MDDLYCDTQTWHLCTGQGSSAEIRWNSLWQIGVKIETANQNTTGCYFHGLVWLHVNATETGNWSKVITSQLRPFITPHPLPSDHPLPTSGTGRWKKSISLSLSLRALLGVDLGELIKRHTKLSPSAIQLGFWRLESARFSCKAVCKLYAQWSE